MNLENREKYECMPDVSIKVGSYVVAIRNINNVQERSVGLVKNISGEEIIVFFIGANMAVKTDSDHIAYLDVKKTGKPYEKKICNICHVLKDRLKEFDINQTNAKGRKTTRPSCKICRIAIDGKSIKPTEKRRLDAMSPKDIFTCPICKKEAIVGVTTNLVKDHDHITGGGREWICDSCNTGLGRFKDDPKLLQSAMDYLKKHS